MRVAAIDIGTNTILMLIADVGPDGHLTVVRDEHAIARLGLGVDRSGSLLPVSIERTLETLERYRMLADASNIDVMVACGTSAFRRASNREDVLEIIRQRIGINVEVISGEKEAELTFLGAVSPFIVPGKQEEFLVLDIGGGSTELTFGTNLRVSSLLSLEIGSVRLTERFLRTSPPASADLESARLFILKHISELKPKPVDRAIGVAGTLTTLAALDLRLDHFDPLNVGGHVLSRNTVHTLFEKLSTMTAAQIASYPPVVRGREDIILAGSLILETLMEKLSLAEVVTSERGLRYGMALRAAHLA
jgi:exopolyphosphatase/guanosine-5'-triphosphate,3'-diphosphate pyrophosphatase